MFSVIITWIHLLAAISWIGGTLFVWFVLKPEYQQPAVPKEELGIFYRIEERFKTIRWISLMTLLVTGIYNLIHEGDSSRMESEWGKFLMIKMFFVVLVIGLMGINDFILSAGKTSGSMEAPTRIKKGMEGMILVVALLIVWVAVFLRHH